MCGIAGIICKNGDSISYDSLKEMTDVIEHRGPDGEGHYIDANVAFGHRRLAIIDLSKDGHQPMRDSGLTITYNGEIYNYLELKEALKKEGFVFKTKTDTEVILKAYTAWGKKCVEKFNGMWSFAIHDKVRNHVFISRDRFGIKPFYYYNDGKCFAFGSEIKQLLLFIQERRVNRKALYDFLYLSYQQHNSDTFFQGVESLLPGHNLFLDTKTGNFHIEKYYTLKKQKPKQDQTIGEAVSLYKNAFSDSIQLRLRSDVRVGTCLSGGLDSSYVAKIAAKNYGKGEPFTAITAKSIDASNDESHFARKVAESYHLNWKTVEPREEDFYGLMDKIIFSQEEPFGTPSIFMQYCVMQKAREEGCIVMLDGQGGDETLLGYERYFVAYLKSIKNPFKFIRQFFKLSGNSRLSPKQLFLYYLYFGFTGIKTKRILSKCSYILEKNQVYLNRELAKKFEQASKDIFELQRMEICELQLPKLLKFEDRNSMAHSIEARVPFIDYKLVELAASIPAEHKIHDGWSKYVLRKCYDENDPVEIAWRKEKFGFEAPTQKWMKDRSGFVKVIKQSDFLDHVIKKNHSFDKLDTNALWKLYNIAKWAEMFKVNY